jgi:hypothetical protein
VVLFRNRSNPAKEQGAAKDNEPDNPQRTVILRSIVPKDNGEDNAAEVAHPTDNTGDDSCALC